MKYASKDQSWHGRTSAPAGSLSNGVDLVRNIFLYTIKQKQKIIWKQS